MFGQIEKALLCGRIKVLRKASGFTLKQLAEQTKLSISYLSKIERGQRNPSIKNLQTICYALNITVNDLIVEPSIEPKKVTSESVELFEDEELRGGSVITKEQRSLIYNHNGVFKLEALFLGKSELKINILTLTGSNKDYSTSKHRYDEVGIVSQGVLEVKLETGAKYILHEQEAVLIHANTEHTICKLSEKDCISFWIKNR